MYGVMKMIPKRCAIYTRKSTDERLDMEFNTLDAQRDSCLNYIASQKSEGWVPVLEEYDDGGYSGGTMDRPALTRLLDDIKANRVDIVVVYKIDRLTRSLADFSKLVEIFDEHNVTFVSITQSFNTTTSMGRLTLNVLLSFAQFEREVASERIRDKIAASKRKGMWTGGAVPLGYNVVDRKLVVNKDEAQRVQKVFEYYLDVGGVSELYRDINRLGIKGKSRNTKGEILEPAPFCASSIHYLLTNPIYIGKARHKGEVYDGQHEAIIPMELWDKVQEKLVSKAAVARRTRYQNQESLLRGILFDSQDRIYIPTYTNKRSKRYRYYKLKEKTIAEEALDRIPAHEIEKRVEDSIRNELCDFDKIVSLFNLHPIIHAILVEEIRKGQKCISSRDLILQAVQKVVVSASQIGISVNIKALADLLAGQSNLEMPEYLNDEIGKINISYIARRAHKGTLILKPSKDVKDPFDMPLIKLKNLVRGILWRDRHFGGESIRQIAREENLSDAYIRKVIMQNFGMLIWL